MNNGSKTNAILSGILVVCIAVLGILAYITLSKKSTLGNNEQTIVEQSANPSPQESNPTPAPFEQAIDSDALKNLSMIKKGILTKSILTNSYSGTIVKTSTSGGYLPSANNFKFKIMIIIKNAQGEQNSFYYNEREAALLQQGVIEALKPEDAITITETIDLQKDQVENIIALDIVKQ